MSPDKRPRRRSAKSPKPVLEVRIAPSSDDTHEIVYFKRHRDEDPEKTLPDRDFLHNVCPKKVRATMAAVLVAVAEAPPKRYPGGGYWEAMKGRYDGLVRGARGRTQAPPLLVVLSP